MTSGEIRRRPLLVAGITALALGACAASASAAAPRIVYSDFAPAGNDIFTVRPDGSGQKQLTDTSAFDQGPSWSPKHKRIVFASTNDAPSHLFTMRANGTHVHKVPHTKFAGDPSWSPDGTRFVYVVENSQSKLAIFTIGVNGKHRKRLTGFGQNVDPDWSPKGKQIVYAGKDGILRMRANGHHKQVVSSSGFEPNWSPKGKLIAYVDDASNPEAVTDVYTIRVNGTHKRNLTGTRPAAPCPDEPDECRRQSEFPAFSPNGKRVAFDETSSGNGDAGIFTVKLDASDVKQVTTSGESADW